MTQRPLRCRPPPQQQQGRLSGLRPGLTARPSQPQDGAGRRARVIGSATPAHWRAAASSVTVCAALDSDSRRLRAWALMVARTSPIRDGDATMRARYTAGLRDCVTAQ